MLTIVAATILGVVVATVVTAKIARDVRLTRERRAQFEQEYGE